MNRKKSQLFKIIEKEIRAVIQIRFYRPKKIAIA